MKAKDRIEICNSCEYRKHLFGATTCGTPIVGEDIIYEGQEKRLCGCIMKIKTELANAECPLKKW